MRDHLIYYESKDLTIAWANKAAAESLNLTPKDLVGKHCYELWQGRNEPCETCAVLKAWETGQPQEIETKSPDGRFWQVRGLPVKNMADIVTAAVEVTREITAKKEAEKNTQEARDRAELYLDLLGHDLNNIHQGIIISLELALTADNLPENIRESLKTSLEQVNRGVNLISNVQKFSTIIESPTDFEELEVLPVLKQAEQIVRSSAPHRNIEINFTILDRTSKVIADDFLVDAFFNILHNSVKHDSKNTVVIDVSVEQQQDSGVTLIQFEDRGPGIDDKTKKDLLNRFESGLKVGTGMGLTVVKRIMNRYGGTIQIADRVEGDYSQGVSFRLYIPTKRE
jgi:signal transduction histidine kinase